MPDINIVRERLEASRRNLLDTSRRNRLINYRISKARGAVVVGGDPTRVFKVLVTDGKPMTFVGKPNKEEQDGEALKENPPVILTDSTPSENSATAATEPADSVDSKLHTNDTASVLSTRLLKTLRDAQSSIEEQGVNILFLAIGMLEWYEADASQEVVKSPLILIPVIIERARGNKFQVRYEDTEIGENLSLAAKLSQEFNIKIPILPDGDELDVKAFFAKVAEAVSPQKRWHVDETAITLGFFSYAKYLMFTDLEGDKWPDHSKPWDHPVIGALLDTGFDDNDSGISEQENLDKHRPIDKSHEVVDADSSQLLALLEARSGRSMLIEGPPGTGKSQTITNLIAEAVAEGKKVLFVSEKRAALEVVWRNLARAKLHEICLELHSNKTHKKTFYTKLKETIDLGRPRRHHAESQLYKLETIRTKLNDYCEAIHQIIPERDISPIEAMGCLVSLCQEQEGLRKPDFSAMRTWRYPEFKNRIDLVARIQAKVKQIGVPSRNPFFDSSLNLLLPDDKLVLSGLIKDAKGKIISLQDSARDLAVFLGFSVPLDFSETHLIWRGADRAVALPPLEGVSVSLEAWAENEKDLDAAIESGKRFSSIRELLGARLKSDAWDTDVKMDKEMLEKYGEKWWRFFVMDYWKTLKRLRGLFKGKLPKLNTERLEAVGYILESQSRQLEIKQNQIICQKFFASQWHGESSDWTTLAIVLKEVVQLQKEVGQKELPKDLLKFLEARYDRESLKNHASHVLSSYESAEKSLNTLLEFIKAQQNLRILSAAPFSQQLERLDIWLSDFSPLEDLISFNHLVAEAKLQELTEVAQIAIEWPQAGEQLEEVFKRTWYSGVLREVCEKRPELAMFDRQSHEAAVDTFQQLDRLMLEYNQAKILLKHWNGVPHSQAGGSLGILQREFEKRSRHRTIRNIMAEAGEAIQAIKPVFMMSPISIAMYLPPDGPKFDLVIFDEASQVKPEDAFCAIIRGAQTIVVGDSKQMPPTSFFDKMMQDGEGQDEEVEDNVTRDIESILGMMSSKLPLLSSRRRDLRWHYRSRHESLIATSNRLFYRERLVVFPTPERKPEGMGLKFNYHPETVYDRGGAKKNQAEAHIVANAVLRHVKENPAVSIGVVAFSLSQQEAIQDELELLRGQFPALNEFDRHHPTEPLFVKNLETVQGDERDVIYISLGYGRDKDNFVSMNFGPVNKTGGERRLNVLITRARVRCEVFSNIRSADLRVAETQSVGVSTLKTFLHFAETGELDVPALTGREPMSPFEEAVIEQIREHGYKVEPQVGSAGFFLDIGVCDPENPDQFVLGIECDGATYHSAKCARDRDRLRQSVLEHRGWRIHRIWSTDWWKNQDRELHRVLAAIDQAISVKGSKPSKLPPPVTPLARDPIPKETKSFPYHVARLQIPGNMKLIELGAEEMGKLVWHIVEEESPVHFEEVVRRIREAAGKERAGSVIRDLVQTGINKLGKKVIYENGFLWKSPKHVPAIRNRCKFLPYLKKIEFIHPEEIKRALIEAVKKSFGISRQEAISLALGMLGFERITDSLSEPIDKLVQELVLAKKITQIGEILKIN